MRLAWRKKRRHSEVKKPGGNGSLVFEPGEYLYSIMRKLLDDDDSLFHAQNAAAFKSIVEQEADNIALILASDETEPYDTLEVIESHKHEQLFESALSFIVTKQYRAEREEKADALGIQDYIYLSAVPSTEYHRFLTN